MDYRSQASNVNSESLASTHRMKAYLQNADGAAVETMVNLETQREQLNRVEGNLDQIDQEIRVADRNLTQMDKFCGMCLCPCRRNRSKNLKTYSADTVEIKYTKSQQKSSSVSKSSSPSKNSKNNNDSRTQDNNRFIAPITGDDKEDEMEANMEDISSYLKDLKIKAKVMGNEIETQNEQIDRVNVKVQRNKENVDLSNRHAANVMANG